LEWSISSKEIIEKRNGTEEGREGNTIIRIQYSTTCIVLRDERSPIPVREEF
jgi:hypothetical protein